MDKETCQVCGYKSDPSALEKCRIVPLEVTRSGGMMESVMVRLCRRCRKELEEWYLTKVSDIVYDTMAKRFRERSYTEMVKEYEYAYHSFAEYKQKQLGLD